MHLKSTLATFVVALLLAGYYTAFEFEPELQRDEQAGEPVVPLKLETLTRIQIAPADGQPIVLTRDLKTPTVWFLEQPRKTRADSTVMHRIYRALGGRTLTSWTANAAARKTFGLERPALVVTLSDGTTSPVLRLGDADPGGRRRYMSRGDGDPARVHLVDAEVHDALALDAAAFEDRRLLRMSDPVARSRSLAFQRGDRSWILGYRNDRWNLDPGGERVGVVVANAISNFLQSRWVTTRPMVDVPVHATILLDMGLDQPLKMHVSELDDDDRYYWVWGPGDTVQYQLDRMHLDDLLAGPEALRSKDILHGKSGARWIVRVELQRDGGQPVDPPIALRKEGALFLVPEDESRQPHHSAVRSAQLLTRLEKTGISKVLVPVATPADLKAHGLDAPATVIKVLKRWNRRGNTHSAWAAIHVGKDVGGHTAIRIEGWPEGAGQFRPGIYGVDRALGLLLRQGRHAFRDARLFHGFDIANRARTLEMYEGSAGTPAVTVTRDPDGKWRRKAGNLDVTDPIVQLLRIFDVAFKANAFEPPGSRRAAFGLDAPDYRIVFTLAGGKTLTLRTKYHGPPEGGGVTTKQLADGPIGQSRIGATRLLREQVAALQKLR